VKYFALVMIVFVSANSGVGIFALPIGLLAAVALVAFETITEAD